MKSESGKILLVDVNQFITCILCKGYLIDATTITECLHTFCKKCIVEYLEENTHCPICDTLLHQSHPTLYIAHDRTLQSIVYKLVANLEKNEIARQCDFYRERQLEFPAQLREHLERQRFSLKKEEGTSEHGQASTSRANDNLDEKHTANGDDKAKQGDENAYHRHDEQVALSLEPLEGLKELKRKFILCSCHVTITHLKKYIESCLTNLSYKDLDIICDDEILGKDHTLKFILVTKWKDKKQPMRLNYRPKLVF